MNANPDPTSEPAPGFDPPIPSRAGWREWSRRLFVCNPFFLCSAALLLLAINRLSTDDRLFASDLHNLIFNFVSLQSYEVIVIGTALILARRRIWYDSALLVVLDSGLALVPFMLITQASIEGASLAWALAAAGGLMAALRCGAVRRWYAQFNLPPRLLGVGVLVLTANVALPLFFWPTVALDFDKWIRPNEIIWSFALPLIAAGANLLPRTAATSQLASARPWLPLLIYALWTVGSGVHAWCVAHICSVSLQWHHFAPVASIGVWTLYLRLTDCIRSPSIRYRAAILLLAAPIPLMAYGHVGALVLFGALNFPAYLLVSWKGQTAETRILARHLALATFAMVFVVIPPEWRGFIAPSVTSGRLVFLGACVYIAVIGGLSRRPELAVPAALATGAIWATLAGASLHQPMQVAWSFLIIHSMRWYDSSIVRNLRTLAILGWVLESFIWTRPLAPFDRDATIAGVIVIIAWAAVWRCTGRRQTWWIPGGALGAMLAAPLHRGILTGSTGVLSLIGSLLLFAVGACVAWNRHRWASPAVSADTEDSSRAE